MLRNVEKCLSKGAPRSLEALSIALRRLQSYALLLGQLLLQGRSLAPWEPLSLTLT